MGAGHLEAGASPFIENPNGEIERLQEDVEIFIPPFSLRHD